MNLSKPPVREAVTEAESNSPVYVRNPIWIKWFSTLFKLVIANDDGSIINALSQSKNDEDRFADIERKLTLLGQVKGLDTTDEVAISLLLKDKEEVNLTDLEIKLALQQTSFESSTVWPIGSVFLSVVSDDPNLLLGFGVWTQIAQGQGLFGFKTGDVDFGTVEGTGGNKTVTHDNNHGAVSINNPVVGTPTDVAATTGHSDHNVLNPYYTIYVWKRVS